MLLRRRHRERRLRARPLLHLVPNIFTIMGLCAGLTGIRYGLDGRFELAVTFILAAGVFDGLDGRSARILKITSKLGAELDSLADFLSFGVAPAVLVYLWSLNQVRGLGWALVLLFATCCALRLARFNAELEVPDRPRWTFYFFTGVPAPAAAGLALVPMIASFKLGDTVMRSWALNAVFLTGVALLMVSRLPTFSLKRIRIKPEYVLPTLLAAGLLIALFVTEPWLVLSLIGVAYLASLPLGFTTARRMRLQEEAQRAAAAAAAEAANSGEAPASGPEGGPGPDTGHTERIVSLDARHARQP
ncbi:MAG TPA: phosphatidylcholine/phosphatidylserine synthase [Geminicoccaceae bacterium]|nr:phosphatidylcholine/phosphatidylserine synthase [Geminicoccaceae bacterium]